MQTRLRAISTPWRWCPIGRPIGGDQKPSFFLDCWLVRPDSSLAFMSTGGWQ